MLGGSFVTMAWHVFRLWMEGSCNYIKYAIANIQQGAVLQLGECYIQS